VKPSHSNDPLFRALPLQHRPGLRLVGELDLSTVGDLWAMVDTLPEGADVFDLSDLSFMDVCGLHAVQEYARTLDGSRSLVLENVSSQVRQLFEVTGADEDPGIELRSENDRG